MNISIILAAGEGTRMKSQRSKVLHKICNKPILEYVIETSKKAGISRNIVVVGDNEKEVKENFSNGELVFKRQPIGEDKPYGTGYAVMQTVDEIGNEDTVLILYGDTPLIKYETIREFMSYHIDNKLDATVLTARIENPKGYGRIIREPDGSIKKIVEEKDASDKERQINEINSGIYCFRGKLLKESLEDIDDNNAQGEYYITDVIEILKSKDYEVDGYLIGDPKEIYGINSRSQLAFCEKTMRKRINDFHMDNGVTIINPENTYIDSDSEIGQDTIIYPGVQIESGSKIGKNCKIMQNSRISNSIIGDGVVIEASVIEESSIGNKTNIGPYTHIRPNSEIGSNIRLGNFVEVKNSVIKDGTKAAHLAYIGDADVGINTNIGCGVVFVNYDGEKKARTTVGDNAFIGSNANLIAPVVVKDYGFVAAGSTITKEVEEGDLAIARAEQVIKKDWIKKRNNNKDK